MSNAELRRLIRLYEDLDKKSKEYIAKRKNKLLNDKRRNKLMNESDDLEVMDSQSPYIDY